MKKNLILIIAVIFITCLYSCDFHGANSTSPNFGPNYPYQGEQLPKTPMVFNTDNLQSTSPLQGVGPFCVLGGYSLLIDEEHDRFSCLLYYNMQVIWSSGTTNWLRGYASNDVLLIRSDTVSHLFYKGSNIDSYLYSLTSLHKQSIFPAILEFRVDTKDYIQIKIDERFVLLNLKTLKIEEEW
ncbi:MAG: hypothetical protein NTX66_00875 [Candidatus Falkowbacteria bacterium]|nr:hypothetical protein [Candidatus Falkowbacteria bacterium]